MPFASNARQSRSPCTGIGLWSARSGQSTPARRSSTPISGPGVKRANNTSDWRAAVSISIPECSCGTHPFLQYLAATDRAKHPLGSSEGACYVCPSPWWLYHPGRMLVPQHVHRVRTILVVAKPSAPIYGWLALQAIRFLHIGDGGTASHSIVVAACQLTIRAFRSPS